MSKSFWNRKRKTFLYISLAKVYLLGIFFWGIFLPAESYGIDYSVKLSAPGAAHIFGTDYMGRDMFFRCIKGLSNSIMIGVLASIISSFIAIIFGVTAALKGGRTDKFVNWCVDLCMGMPHLILLILISFMMEIGRAHV